MNKTFTPIPRPTDTLDFYNWNNWLDTTLHQLNIAEKYVQSQEKELASLKINDGITKNLKIVSNGIKNYFSFDYRTNTVSSIGNVRVSGRSFTKSTHNIDDLSNTAILNLEEIYNYVSDSIFYPKTKVFDAILKKSDAPLSNLVALSDAMAKTYDKSNPIVEVVTPTVIQGPLVEGSLVSISTMNSYFLTKNTPLDRVYVKNDNISFVNTKNVELIDPVMSDEYSSDNNDSILMFGEALNRYVGIEGNFRSYQDIIHGVDTLTIPIGNLTIENPSSSLSPLNKGILDETKQSYISTVDTLAINLLPVHDGPLTDNSLLTYTEADKLVKDAFAEEYSPKTVTFAEYEELVNGLCNTDNKYLLSDYKAPLDKAYIGFDYDNMHSILNEKALKDILYRIKGKYTSSMGKVFLAARYFKSQEEANLIASYLNSVGLHIDIGTDTIGHVYSQLLEAVGRLCRLDPSMIPETEPEPIPSFEPTFSLIPPIVTTSFPYISISPFILEPFYIEEYIDFSLLPPLIGNNEAILPTPIFPLVPMYIEESHSYNSTPPRIGLFSYTKRTNIIRDDLTAPKSEEIKYFTSEVSIDASEPSMVAFASQDGCSNRFRLDSYRYINMMEVAMVARGVLGSVLSSQNYMYDEVKSYVITKPQMATLLLGDIFCYVKDKLDGFPVAIDMRKTLEEIVSDDGSSDGEDTIKKCLVSGASTVTTLQDETKDIKFVLANMSSRTDTGVTDITAPSINRTEILEPYDDFGAISMGWETPYKSEAYNNIVVAIGNTVSNDIKGYITGKRADKPDELVASDYGVASLDNITHGDFLVEYLRGVTSQYGGSKITNTADRFGIFTDTTNMTRTTLSSFSAPFSNVMIGNLTASTPSKDRRDNPTDPKPGPNQVYIWRPNFSSTQTKVENLPHLSLADDTTSIMSIYGPMILFHKDGDNWNFDNIGVNDLVIETEELATGEYRKVTSGETSVILGRVANTAAPHNVPYTRDYCDDWISPLQIFSSMNMGGDSTLSPLITQGGFGGSSSGTREGEKEYVSTKPKTTICGEYDPVGSSGIDPTVFENISDLTSLDPNAPAQEPGDVPGAYSINLNMKAAKYVPYRSGDEIINKFDISYIRTCLVFGVIDGKVDDGGDVLAQGYAKDSIPAGTDKIYIGPPQSMVPYLTCERKIVNSYDVSVFTFSLADFIANEIVKKDDDSVLFTQYFDIVEELEDHTEVEITSKEKNFENEAPYGTMLVGEFRTPGAVFMYKHAGQDPKLPIITGFSGSTEVDFVNGDRLVASLPVPIPTVVYTEADDAEALLPTVNMELNSIFFFINKKTIQVMIKDTKAVFSENRTVKTIFIPPSEDD